MEDFMRDELGAPKMVDRSTFQAELDVTSCAPWRKAEAPFYSVPVTQVMTHNVSTCDVNDSIGSVMDRMTKGKFRHMPVLDKDRLVGLVSIGDALKWHVETIREYIHQLEVSLTEFDLVKL